MNIRSIITINTPFAETGNIEIEEIVKQVTTYGPVMCCAAKARVNDIGEKVFCKDGDTEIGMPVFMDDISAVGDAEEVRKGALLHFRTPLFIDDSGAEFHAD